MKNKQSGKTIVCFSDYHENYFLHLINEQHKAHFEEIIDKQKNEITSIANTINNLDTTKGSETIIITESGPIAIGSIIDDFVLGHFSIEKNMVLHTLPKLFLTNILSEAIKNNTIIETLEAKLQRFQAPPGAVGFYLDSNAQWIFGDNLRTDTDSFIAFEAYSHWENIKHILDIKKEASKQLEDYTLSSIKKYLKNRWMSLKITLGLAPNISQDIEQITISYVMEYLIDLKKYYDTYQLPCQSCFDNIMNIINEVFETNQLQPTNHIVELHQYLLNTNQSSKRDELNNNIIMLISLKFDLELAIYLNSINNIESQKNIIFTVGLAHSPFIKEFAYQNNYELMHSCGLPEELLAEACTSTNPELLQELIAMLPSQAPTHELSEIIKNLYS